jgi:hypothetical protein
MEYERSIFRVYERTIPTKFFMNFSIFCSSFFTAMFLVSTVLFIIANTMLTDGGGIIKNQWQLYLKNEDLLSQSPSPSSNPLQPTQNASPNPIPLTPDPDPQSPTKNHILTAISSAKFSSQEQNPTLGLELGLTNDSVFASKDEIVKKLSEISTSDHLDIHAVKRTGTYMHGDIVNIHFFNLNAIEPDNNKTWDSFLPVGDYDLSEAVMNLTVSASMYVVEVDKDVKVNWWIRHHAIVVDIFSWYKKNGVGAMIELEDMIILDIINTWKNDTIFIDQRKWTKWFGPAMTEINQAGSVPIYSKISIVLYLFIGLFILSFAASLYTKAITFLSPLLLYGLIKIVSGGRYFMRDERDQRMFLANYYRAFTWVGIYLYALNRRRRKVFEPFFIGAHVLFVIVLYVIYIGLTKMCYALVAWKPVNPETMSNLCGMISGVELGCVFFIRSKQGLYFAPKIIY